MAKPDVDILTGLPPTVAIEQRLSRGGRTSTVATVTEVAHYLRLLFAKVGVQHCPQCDEPIRAQTRRQILDRVRREARGERAHPAGAGRPRPQGLPQGGPGRRRASSGCAEARIDGKRVALASVGLLDRYREHDIDLVVGSDLAPGSAALDDELDPGAPTRQRVRRGAVGRGRAALLRAPLLPRVQHRLPAARPAAVLVQQPAGRLPGLRRERRPRRAGPGGAARRRSYARWRRARGPSRIRPAGPRSATCCRRCTAHGVPLDRPVERLTARQRRTALERRRGRVPRGAGGGSRPVSRTSRSRSRAPHATARG